MYYVTIKARRKNGKRHIHDRFKSYDLAIKYVKKLSDLNSKYIIEVCDARWNTLYTAGVTENDKMSKKGKVNSYYGMACTRICKGVTEK